MPEEMTEAPSIPMPKTERRRVSGFLSSALPALSVPAVLLLWEAVIRGFAVEPFVFPAPSAVAVALWSGLSSGTYLEALWVTLTEILAGFALGSAFGFGLGLLLASVAILNRIIFPWVVGIQTIPKVAIAPLMIVWFGFGIESKVLIVALTCLFPVLVNTMAGLRATERSRIDLIRAHGGRHSQVVRFVLFPSALPYIFAGLNTAMVLAVIGAIVGEFVGARSGIGVLILQANFNLDLAAVFALLVILAVVGITLNSAIRFVERKVCFWNGRKN